MTTATAPTNPFDFAPQPQQDSELLHQLGFIPGFKEMLTVRQVHALEHATVWVLSEPEFAQSDRLLGGMSTETGFYLYGDVPTPAVHRAVRVALDRITSGEWDLAVHPRCGTNLSVGMLMTAGLAIGINLLLPKGPIEQLLGLGVAAAAATSVAPDVGGLAQKYVTTAIPFNLAIAEIRPGRDWSGRSTHFVQIRWVEPQLNVASSY
ncbi:MAG: hypothetical protein F6K28_47080 [Microcoleus sp. SIO2G3]|nr:hypothetical protein [Microcoleus sp. SIO2G3]